MQITLKEQNVTEAWNVMPKTTDSPNHNLLTALSNTNCTFYKLAMEEKNCSDAHWPEDRDDNSINLNAELHMQIIYTIIGVMGISGNALVAGVLFHFKSMRKSLTNTFIINQSLIDGASSFFIVLSAFIRDVDMISSELGQELFCRLWLTNLPIWSIFVSSTYNMVAVTFERYYAVVHPLTHHQYTRKKALVIIAVVWIFGPAYNAAYMIPTAGMVNGQCTVYSIWPSPVWQSIVGIITVFLQYFIPLGLIIYAYTRIALVLTKARNKNKAKTNKFGKSSNRDLRITKARRNVIKTLAMVSACFVFCWSWNQIYYTMYNLGFNADFNGTFYHFTVIMVFCNCCINPFIYAIKYDQFKKGVKKIFCTKKGSNDGLSASCNGAVSEGKDDIDTTYRIQRNHRMLQRMSSDPMLVNPAFQADETHNNNVDETCITTISGNFAYCTHL